MNTTKWACPGPIWSSIWTCPPLRRCSCSAAREASTHTSADIHELDTGYLAACRDCALQAAQLLNWKVVPCVDSQGSLRSIEEIHQEIWTLTASLL